MSRLIASPDYPFLLVEDNPDDVLITKRAFAMGRIYNKLYVVQDGEEAIDFVRKRGKYKDAPTPALILLDLKLPKVNGFEVLKEIKSDENLKSIPVIVLTSSERDKDIEEAYKMGCNNYIVKPVSFENFIKTVVEIREYWLIISRIPTR
ncbi:MAG: response regulator [Candidatus Bathyarchaeia archaeon]|nr:response regulator [Candidatus Bathyarchaeota archaeon]